jgi:hypothetical protein
MNREIKEINLRKNVENKMKDDKDRESSKPWNGLGVDLPLTRKIKSPKLSGDKPHQWSEKKRTNEGNAKENKVLQHRL